MIGTELLQGTKRNMRKEKTTKAKKEAGALPLLGELGEFSRQLSENQKEVFTYYAGKVKLPKELRAPCKKFFQWGFEYGAFLLYQFQKATETTKTKGKKNG